MKKIGIFIILLIFGISVLHAQTVKLELTSTKDIMSTDNGWENWPDQWTNFKDIGTVETYLQFTMKNGKIKKYDVKYFQEGNLQKSFAMTYDSNKTEKKRKELKNENIYCYTDGDDDIEVHGNSLADILKDKNKWSENSDSKIVVWINSDGYAFAVK